MEREQIVIRLAVLEAAIHQLKEQLASGNGSGPASRPSAAGVAPPEGEEPWYIKYAGRFADDPVFDEIVRLGREYRESLRPEPDEGDDARP